jgi:hypothetical protein
VAASGSPGPAQQVEFIGAPGVPTIGVEVGSGVGLLLRDLQPFQISNAVAQGDMGGILGPVEFGAAQVEGAALARRPGQPGRIGGSALERGDGQLGLLLGLAVVPASRWAAAMRPSSAWRSSASLRARRISSFKPFMERSDMLSDFARIHVSGVVCRRHDGQGVYRRGRGGAFGRYGGGPGGRPGHEP